MLNDSDVPEDSITAEVEGKRAPLKDAPTSPAILRDADKSHVVSHILRSWPNAQSKRKAQSRGSGLPPHPL